MFESVNENKQYCTGSADDRNPRPMKCFTSPDAMNTFCNMESSTLYSSSIVMGSSSVEYDNFNDSFPFKLHIILREIEEQGLSHIVAWQPHGRCFVVHNRRDFVVLIMPSFFRMSKYESFQRQLNLYGFNRITAGRDKGGYYHESFVRDRRDLCFEIQRQKVKGTVVRKPATRETEPNFYMLPSTPKYATKTISEVPPQTELPSVSSVPAYQVLPDFAPNIDMVSGPDQSLVSVMMPNPSNVAMMQTFMNMNPSMATVHTDGQLGCHRGGEYNLPSFPILGDRYSETSSSQSYVTDPNCASVELQTPQVSMTKQTNQQLILDDLDSSFENLLSALRTLDSIYLMSIGHGA